MKELFTTLKSRVALAIRTGVAVILALVYMGIGMGVAEAQLTINAEETPGGVVFSSEAGGTLNLTAWGPKVGTIPMSGQGKIDNLESWTQPGAPAGYSFDQMWFNSQVGQADIYYADVVTSPRQDWRPIFPAQFTGIVRDNSLVGSVGVFSLLDRKYPGISIEDQLLIPAGYVSGSVMPDFSGLFEGHTFASLSLNPGSYEWSWGSGVAERIILNIVAPPNQPPTSDAGADQSIRADDTVYLDGSASFDDNTVSANLLYSWTFSSLPAGSTAILSGAETATPSFVADFADTYVVNLIVTDEGGLPSVADEVIISSDNLAPTAAAGEDQLVVAGTTVNLDGSNSLDPEMDALTYAWTLTSAPGGSAAVLAGATSDMPSFNSDLAGIYTVSLVVSDFIGPGTPDTVEITAASASDYSQLQIVSATGAIASLGSGQVTTGGNQNALLNFLSQAVDAIQEGDLARAVDKLEKSMVRTDGCVLRGSPDGNGSGRDWITDCTAQVAIYGLLDAALDALSP